QYAVTALLSHSLLLALYAFVFSSIPLPPTSTLFPYTTLFRSHRRDRLWIRRVASCPHGLRFHPLPSTQDTVFVRDVRFWKRRHRSEEHTSELQSHLNLVCRLLLEKKKSYSNDLQWY